MFVNKLLSVPHGDHTCALSLDSRHLSPCSDAHYSMLDVRFNRRMWMSEARDAAKHLKTEVEKSTLG